MTPIIVDIEQATQITPASRDVLYQLMKIGKLRFNQIGRKRMIEVEHLKEVLLNEPISSDELAEGRA